MSPEAVARITSQLSGPRPILTDEVHRVITEAGHPPAPVLESVDCSCSDGTGNCLHVLAIYYEMARRVDDDPRIALDIQEFSRARAVSVSTRPTAAASPQRWVALNSLDPDHYFTVPK